MLAPKGLEKFRSAIRNADFQVCPRGLHLTETIIVQREEHLSQIYQNYTHLLWKCRQSLNLNLTKFY